MLQSKSTEPDPLILQKIHSLKSKKGKMVAIEPLSKKWFIGDTLIDAIKKAKKHSLLEFFILKK
jgi:hypothetical protein